MWLLGVGVWSGVAGVVTGFRLVIMIWYAVSMIWDDHDTILESVEHALIYNKSRADQGAQEG